MRMLTFFLFVAFLTAHASGVSQTITLSGQDVSIQRIIAAIKKQTGFMVFGNEDLLKEVHPVTLSVHKMPLSDFLAIALKDQPLTSMIEGKTIFLSRKTQGVPVGNPFLAFASITGQFLDADTKEPLNSVSVTIKGTRLGTSSDGFGRFSLSGFADDAVLVISSVGYTSLTISYSKLLTFAAGRPLSVDGNKIIKLNTEAFLFYLHKAVNQLESFTILNKGYYTEKKDLSTSFVSTVTADVISKQPVSDPLAALIGRVPGLQITQLNGVPGSSFTVRLRGQNSIANGNDPLYIVDGVPFSSQSLTYGSQIGAVGSVSPFNSLDPAEIEAIDVLKDGDATAIYGSRAANGVILITTKRGKIGKTTVDANVYRGGGQVPKTIDLFTTEQYLEVRKEAFDNDGLPVPTVPGYNNYDLTVWDQNRNTDWSKVLIGGTAQYTDMQVSVSGGNAGTQFYLSGGYNKQTTVYPGDFNNQNISTRMNFNHASANQKFKAGVQAGYSNNNSHLPTTDLGKLINLAPNAPEIYKSDGGLNWELLPNGVATWANPFATLLQTFNSSTDNLLGNISLSYNLTEGLEIRTSIGYNKIQMEEHKLTPLTSFEPARASDPKRRSHYFTNSVQSNLNIEPKLTYKRKILRGFLDGLIGGTYQASERNAIAQTASNFSNDDLIENVGAATTVSVGGTRHITYKYAGIFARIGYTYQDKYVLNLTGRRDGSSRFAKGKQFGNFGSIGLAWIFSKERFLEDNIISFGKLRASYGTTGNDQLTDYQYLSSYQFFSTSPYQGMIGLYPARIANPYFSWETINKVDIGIDMRLIKDRISLSGTYFRNRTGNQLVGYPLPSLTGFSTIQANLPAVLQNSGMEVELNTMNVKGKYVTWTTSINLTILRNKLISYPDLASSSYVDRYTEGEPLIGQKFYHYLGVDPQTGLFTFETDNSSGVPSSPKDLKPIGKKTVPQKYFGGINNTITYKGFSLDVFLQFVNQEGQKLVSLAGMFNNNHPQFTLKRWQKPGDISTYQRVYQSFSTDASRRRGAASLSSYSITDASFIRLKNLSFSYTIPDFLKKALHIQNLRIYLQGQNLWTWTNYEGNNPERPSSSINAALPVLKIWTAGIQLTL